MARRKNPPLPAFLAGEVAFYINDGKLPGDIGYVADGTDDEDGHFISLIGDRERGVDMLNDALNALGYDHVEFFTEREDHIGLRTVVMYRLTALRPWHG